MSEERKSGRIMSLDVSTKTIGIALFEGDGTLMELTHITPVIKPKPESKMEELFKKVDAFEKLITRYIELDIERVVIEEPLLSSNNVYTIATLLKFNGMISKVVSEVLNVIPEFISSYDSRMYAFPELVQKRKTNKKGEPYKEKDIERAKPVLFGDYPWDIDKKQVIWEKVANLQPQIVWEYDKNGKLKKENFDMTDAFTSGRAIMCKDGLWDCKN
jgi:RNase H-fold protein (predicted Holliday junction resolvase)